MLHSDTLGELAKALAAAQKDFKPVGKDKTAKAGSFSYKYADLADVVAMAAPILASHGLSVTQFPEYIYDTGHEELTTMLMHSSGEWMRSSMPLYPVKREPQAQGSAITYARRYSYSAILGLVTDDDDDGQAAKEGAQQSRPAPKWEPKLVDYARGKPQQQQQTASQLQPSTPPTQGEIPEGYVTWNYARTALASAMTAAGKPDNAVRNAHQALIERIGEQTEFVARTALDAARDAVAKGDQPALPLVDKARAVQQRTRPAPQQ